MVQEVFFHLLDLSVLNPGIAYNSILGKKLKLPEFRLNLIKQMIQVHSKTDILVSPGRKGRKIKGDHPLRLTSRHFPSKLKTDKDGKKVVKRDVMNIC